MVFVGIDVGNSASCVALAIRGQREITTAQDVDGHKETSTVVQYGAKMRAVGFKATGGHASNVKSTITQVKRLIGRDYDDLQHERFMFDVAEVVAADSMPGKCQISVNGQVLSPEQVLVSVLKHLKETADRETRSRFIDGVVMSVPCFYGQAERLSTLAAAEVAGWKDVTLIHELTAAALEWVASRPEFPEIRRKNVAFVDVGHSATQVCLLGCMLWAVGLFRNMQRCAQPCLPVVHAWTLGRQACACATHIHELWGSVVCWRH